MLVFVVVNNILNCKNQGSGLENKDVVVRRGPPSQVLVQRDCDLFGVKIKDVRLRFLHGTFTLYPFLAIFAGAVGGVDTEEITRNGRVSDRVVSGMDKM